MKRYMKSLPNFSTARSADILPRQLNFPRCTERIAIMQAIILSIGDELVLGQTVDTNSAWLSQQLAAVGCSAVRHITVGDDQNAIERGDWRVGAGRCDAAIDQRRHRPHRR